MLQVIYAGFFLLALFSALMVVLTTHAVYSALYLVLTMISISGLFVLMNAQLAAAFQIIVYAGAIMVLFLFVIMLLNIGRTENPPLHNKYVRRLGVLFALTLLVQLLAMLAQFQISGVFTLANNQGIQIRRVAMLLLTDYIYAFEMTSILLLVAVVGAVVLARKRLVQGAAAPGERYH